MIDLHCHLDLYDNPKEVIKRSNELGIFVLSVTTTPSAFEITERLSSSCSRIRTAIGLHPQIAHERHTELEIFRSLVSKARYVGEVGLDGSKDFARFSSIQQIVFEDILAATQASGGKIISVHSRSAASQVVSTIKKFPSAGIPIFHWFSGNQAELREAIDIGAWFSVNPLMLMSKKGKELVRLMPINRVLTETDGPFTRNKSEPFYPWEASLAHPLLSQIWGVPEGEVIAQLLSNLKELTSASL